MKLTRPKSSREIAEMPDTVTVARLIELLQALPNQQALIYVHDPEEEVDGTIRGWVGDVITPTDGTEVYIIADFG